MTRTLFRLRYISEADFRQSVRAETTKVESYNDFLDWIAFGGPILKNGDPVEQAKQVKYMVSQLGAHLALAQQIAQHRIGVIEELLADGAEKG